MKTRNTVILAVLGLALVVALSAWAQATVDLFPDVQVSDLQRTTAVVSVCSMSGYSECSTDGEITTCVDPAIVFNSEGWITGHAWTQDAAMWQHYKRWLIREVNNERFATWAATETAAPEDFE